MQKRKRISLDEWFQTSSSLNEIPAPEATYAGINPTFSLESIRGRIRRNGKQVFSSAGFSPTPWTHPRPHLQLTLSLYSNWDKLFSSAAEGDRSESFVSQTAAEKNVFGVQREWGESAASLGSSWTQSRTSLLHGGENQRHQEGLNTESHWEVHQVFTSWTLDYKDWQGEKLEKNKVLRCISQFSSTVWSRLWWFHFFLCHHRGRRDLWKPFISSSLGFHVPELWKIKEARKEKERAKSRMTLSRAESPSRPNSRLLFSLIDHSHLKTPEFVFHQDPSDGDG